MNVDGPSPVVPFIYDTAKKELKVATTKDSPMLRPSPFLAAVNATLARFYEYNTQPGMMSAGELWCVIARRQLTP